MGVLKIFYFSFSSVTPAQWESFSNENILKAEKEQNASATLRGVIDEILKETRQDIEQQRTTVNLAFNKRIQEITEAKKSLEQHLNKVIEPLFYDYDMEAVYFSLGWVNSSRHSSIQPLWGHLVPH